MRYPKGHADEIRRRLLLAAADAFREEGLAGVGIPALMKRVGLTHGAFYTHFESRDELEAEAVLAAAEQTGEQVFAGVDLATAVSRYVSREHVDHPHGCIVAALGAGAPTRSRRVRGAFGLAARGLLRLLDEKRRSRSATSEIADETLVRASMMIGAVVLARIVDDPRLADRIVAAVRAAA